MLTYLLEGNILSQKKLGESKQSKLNLTKQQPTNKITVCSVNQKFVKPLPNFWWASGFIFVILHNLKIKSESCFFQSDTSEIQGIALITYLKLRNFTFINFVTLFGGGDVGFLCLG